MDEEAYFPVCVTDSSILKLKPLNSSIVAYQPLKDAWDRLDKDSPPVQFEDMLSNGITSDTVVRPYLDKEHVRTKQVREVHDPMQCFNKLPN